VRFRSASYVPTGSYQGTIIHSVPDGNCLFHSVGHFAHQTAHHLRRRAVEWIRAHKNETVGGGETLEAWIRMATNCCVDKYTARAAHPGTWGGEIELFALHRLLGKDVYVFHCDTAPVPSLTTNSKVTYTDASGRPTEATIVAVHENGTPEAYFTVAIPTPGAPERSTTRERLRARSTAHTLRLWTSFENPSSDGALTLLYRANNHYDAVEVGT
jgi:hypothetical protein